MAEAISTPCESCAFSPAGEAHGELYNRLRAEVCAATGVPFWCHHSFDWQQPRVITRESFRNVSICAGWKREVVQHIAQSGSSGSLNRRVLRARGELILDMIREYVRLPRGKEKAVVLAALNSAIRNLHADEGFVESQQDFVEQEQGQ